MPDKPRSHRPGLPAARQPENRPSAAKRGYGRAWQRASKARLDGEVCLDCGAAGRTEPATELHHPERHGGDPALVLGTIDECIPLCKSCHSKRTARGE